MKIVYLYSSLAITGGIERVLIDKMNYLVNRYGYEVYMITSDQGHTLFLISWMNESICWIYKSAFIHNTDIVDAKGFLREDV